MFVRLPDAFIAQISEDFVLVIDVGVLVDRLAGLGLALGLGVRLAMLRKVAAGDRTLAILAYLGARSLVRLCRFLLRHSFVFSLCSHSVFYWSKCF